MPGQFRIAEGYVEVTADETGYDRALQRLKSKKTTATILLDLDDSQALAKLRRFADEHSRTVLKAVIDADLSQASARRVSAALDKLTADRVVNIRANVDTRVGAAEIRNLIQRRQVRIGIDVDTRVAADSLANLTRRRQMTVQARADTADADARLRYLTRDRRVDVRLNVDRSQIAMLSSIGSGGGGGVTALGGSLARLAAVAAGSLPTLASLGQSIAAMGPAAAVAAPAVLSLGAAFAAVKLGTSGIGDAFKAAFAPAVSSGAAATTATNRVADAQRSLAKAQQQVKDAEVNAAAARVQAARQIQDAQQSLRNTVQDVADANRRADESVASAERQLADAQRSARQAQLDLTQARKQAAQDLEDLNNRLADAQLDQRQKVLDVQDAEQNLAAVKAKGASASQEDLAKAQLQYDQAVQALQEQQTETARLQQQTTDANAAGVEGSQTVKDAKQNEADATQKVKDQTQDLKDAEIERARTAEDGVQRVAKAERDLADARAAARKAAVDGARQIADAEQGVADAARNVAEAQTAGAATLNKTADALARLAPNARSFVQAVIAQAGAWRALKLDVQNTLFAGLGQTFTTMSTAILPSLRAGLTGTAGILNTTAKNAANAVTQLGKTGQLRQMFDGLNAGMRPLSRIPGQIVTGLAQISIAASPAFKRLTSAAAGAADNISKKLNGAFKSGALTDSINGAINIAKQFGKLIGDVFGTFGNIMKAAAAGGGNALGTLGNVFTELRKITALPGVQKGLTSIFKAVGAVGKLLAGTVGKLVVQLVEGFGKIAPTITTVVGSFQNLAPLLGAILLRANPVLGTLALIAPILPKLAAPISKLIAALAPMLDLIGKFATDLMTSLSPLIGSVLVVLADVFKALSPVLGVVLKSIGQVVGVLAAALVPVVDALIPIVKMLGGFLGQLAPMFPQIMQAIIPLIPPLSQLAVSLLGLAMQVLQPLLPLIVRLAGLLTSVLTGAITTLVPAITMVIGWLTKFVDAVTSVVKWIVDKFTWLYDTLVGHSIIPDLVNAIITWFTSLWTKTKQLFTQLKDWVVKTWNDLWNAARTKWNSFWSGLQGAISGAWSWAKSSFSGLKTSITNTWHGLWNDAYSKLSSVISSIKGKISTFSTSMKSAFSHLRDSLGSIWNGIESKISSPVKWVISHVYNSGIRSMWNTIAGKISSKITLPYISLGFSEGGVVPGKPTNKDTVPAMLAPGERVLSNQQVDQLGGQSAIDTMLGKAPTQPTRQDQHRPVPGFFGGGIIGSISDALGSAASWAKNLVVGGLKDAASKAISAVIRPLINRIPGGAGLGGLLKGMSNKALSGILGWMGGQDKKAMQVDYKPGAGVAQWAPQIMQALRLLGQSTGWLGTVERRMNQESGGNPRAVNLWDINAQNGTPSVGLMQVIGPTFRAHAGQFRNTGPFMYGTSINPLANIYAGLNYAIGRYGSLSALNRPGGYDDGGLLQPGATMAVNGTGRPERVLDARQTALFEQMVNGRGGGVVIQHLEVKVDGTFDFGKPAEAKRAADQLAGAMNESLRKWNRARA